MTGVGFHSLDDAQRLVTECSVAVQQVRLGEFWKLDGDELLDLGRELETLSRLLWAAQVHLVDELTQQGVAASRSVSSTAVLIRQAFNIGPGEAGARVAAARAILPQAVPSGGETPAIYPTLGAAIDTGSVAGEHVRTVLATLRRLPDALPAEVRAHAERVLVEHAQAHDPEQFTRIARHLESVLNPDGPTPSDEAAHAKCELNIGNRSTATGLTSITGYLDDLGAATLRAVIDPLAAPKPSVDGLKDPRPLATRRAHALIEALSFVLNHGDAVLPDAGGERPHLTVTLDWDVLRHTVKTAALDTGWELSVGDTRQLLCDAQVTPAVLGGASQVLDVGRSSRTATPAIRRALTLRDKGCSFPGCDRPPAWCDAHHVDWWVRDLGNTSSATMTLLCGYHHRQIHLGEWEIHFADDGVPEYRPPRWMDPERRPRRNILHHINPIRRT